VRREGPDAGEALFVGLPGNPVSSFVTFLVAVSPLLRALQGLPAQPSAGLPMRADFDWPRPDRRREFLRVRLNGSGGVELFPNQSSGVLTSTVWADALVDNPPGQAVARGDTVRVWLLREMIGA
jgi:molybdopterin molybdotransferase